MSKSRPSSPEVFEHVQAIFHDAAFTNHLGITLEAAGPGWCETSLTIGSHHLQQHGYAHGGVITTPGGPRVRRSGSRCGSAGLGRHHH